MKPPLPALALLAPLCTACAADPGDSPKSAASSGQDEVVTPEPGTGGDGASGAGDVATSQAYDAAGNAPPPSGDDAPSNEANALGEASSTEAAATLGADAADANVPDVAPCPTCALELRYMTSTPDAMTQEIRPHYEIHNNGSSPQDLTVLTVRYYYTADGSTEQAYDCDYAQIGCGLIQAAFVALTPAKTSADHYIELSFTGGSIPAGGDTGEIQIRFHDAGYQVTFTQTNDYSFDGAATQYADWSNVTVYRSGTLVWGAEPQ